MPQSKFHLTLDCKVSQNLWNELEPHLLRLHQQLRHCIGEQESIAYHNKKGLLNERELKIKYNEEVKAEAMQKYRIYSHLGRTEYFDKIFAFQDYLLIWENDWYQILTLYRV